MRPVAGAGASVPQPRYEGMGAGVRIGFGFFWGLGSREFGLGVIGNFRGFGVCGFGGLWFGV